MKKLLCLPVLVLLLTLANVSIARAKDVNVFNQVCTAGDQSTLCTEAAKNQLTTDNGIYGKNGILNKVANLVLTIVGVAAVIMIIYGGIQYALSGGEANKINAAKNIIIYAIGGMVVAFAAKGIISYVLVHILK